MRPKRLRRQLRLTQRLPRRLPRRRARLQIQGGQQPTLLRSPLQRALPVLPRTSKAALAPLEQRHPTRLKRRRRHPSTALKQQNPSLPPPLEHRTCP